MLRKLVLLVAPLLGVSVAAALWAGGQWPFGSHLVRVCEDALRETLLAPSTYRRLAAREATLPLDLETWLAAGHEPETVKKFYRSLGTDPRRFSAVIDYEAGNAYGARVRGLAGCTYDTLSATPAAATRDTVRIDGRTLTDRLVERLRSR